MKNQKLIASIASQIRACRIQRGLTQRQLAALCGTSQPVIVRMESALNPNAPSTETLEKIAAALGLELVVELRPLNEVEGWPI